MKNLVVLESLKTGQRFMSSPTEGQDPTKLITGEVAYKLLGYANTHEEAMAIINETVDLREIVLSDAPREEREKALDQLMDQSVNKAVMGSMNYLFSSIDTLSKSKPDLDSITDNKCPECGCQSGIVIRGNNFKCPECNHQWPV